jgi:hypothetical protein
MRRKVPIFATAVLACVPLYCKFQIRYINLTVY